MKFDFWVARRGLDPAAATCAHALRDLLHAPVRQVERGVLWRFDAGSLPVDDDLRRRVESAACRAGRYVNLNRDACGFVTGARPIDATAPAGCFAADVWVCDGDGRDAAALQWFRSQAHPDLADLQRGVLWRLFVTAADVNAARELAAELATARGRTQGLLANPHAQTADVLHVLPPGRSGD